MLRPTAADSTSFCDGRYQVLKFLGEGGKKRVYLAHDTKLDRDVAFALIKTEGLDAEGLARIRREAQAMGRLGDHPNIVSVHDIGEEPPAGVEDRGLGAGGTSGKSPAPNTQSPAPAQPYIVSQLMPGGDVEGLVERAEGHRVPLDVALRIADEVCRALEHAHSHGIVHRDLKPGNVWLTADGTAKLGDFGLAVALDRTRLTQAGMMVGTVHYMPPEQAMGGEIAPASDLYSLGAMLYEMVTGRPPFLGQDHVAIIGQHLNVPPVAPSWHNPACPRPLEALILRLLAKDPKERPPSARDVRAALQAIDLAVGPPAADEPQAEPHVLDSLAGGVFVGRQREMGELKAALEDALSGRGRLVMLVGEPGIGKTRTALELATYAGLRQAQVLWGRCYEGSGAPPYWPWVQALRSYIADRDDGTLRGEMGAGAADIAEVVSEVRGRLPDLKPSPALEPEQARFRLFDSITTFLKNAGRRQPLVLVIEDLHWADRPSLLLLEFLARELATTRLLVVGTYRDVDLSRQHPLALSLGELVKERLFQRIPLRGLSPEDVGRFIELAAGVTPSAGLVGAVHRQTEGNPLFVTEVVRLLVQEGHLGRDARNERTAAERGDSDTWAVRIPEGVREVIGRRLDRLSQRCNQVLTIAAIVGREFTLEQLQPLVEDLSGERLLDVLEEALGARIIEELPRAAGRYQFTHSLIQETLAEELSTTRRVLLHGRIAQTLEELYGAEAEAHAAELAYHYGEAATAAGPEKLVHYSLVAGERALGGYAYEEALAYFQRGLAAREGRAVDSETAALLFGLGRARAAVLPLERLPEAVATLGQAFDYYAQTGDVARAVAVAEQPFPPVAGHAIGAGDLIARALALVPADSHEAGRLLALHGRILGVEEGDYGRAQEALERALAIARREGDVALEMRTLVSASEVEGYHARLAQAREKGLLAARLASRVDDPRLEMLAHYWATYQAICEGDTSAAQRGVEAVLLPAERLRQPFYVARALFINDLLCRVRGQWDAAREFSDRGLQISPREPRLLFSRAFLELELGELEAAEARLGQVIELMRLTPEGPTLEHTYCATIPPLLARAGGKRDYLDLAQKAGHLVVSSPLATPLMSVIARSGLGLLAAYRADMTEANEHYQVLAASRDLNTIFITCGVPVDQLLGILARAAGRLDEAAAHFEEGVSFCRSAGYLPPLAWTLYEYAECLLQRDRSDELSTPSDRVRALELLDEGLKIARELRMRPLIERLLARRQLLSA